MDRNKCKLIIFIFLLTVSTYGFSNDQWVYDDLGCRTPDRGVGNCVVIYECKSMLDFLREVPTITPEISRYLRNYKCGYQGQLTKVCCPNKSIAIMASRQNTGRTLIPVTPTTPLPPDVRNHRNLHLLSPVGECGPFSIRDRIINGNKTALYEFPWMALISYQTRTGPGFRCGGTLINNRYILTAAHCITHLDNLPLLGVRLGEYNITSEPDCQLEGRNNYVCAEPVQDIYIDAIIPHPNFNYITLSNDIGLLRLRTPAQFKETVRPICLPTGEIVRHKNFTDAKLLVTGWGFTGPGSSGSDVLLKVEVPVMAETACKSVYNQTSIRASTVIDYRHLCAGGIDMKDSCGGDSGGPLQMTESFDGDVQYVQYGIVSFGHRICGEEGFPGVYTRIDYYMDWILDNIRP